MVQALLPLKHVSIYDQHLVKTWSSTVVAKEEAMFDGFDDLATARLLPLPALASGLLASVGAYFTFSVL